MGGMQRLKSLYSLKHSDNSNKRLLNKDAQGMRRLWIPPEQLVCAVSHGTL